MAACGSLQHLFDKKPMPEKPTRLESLATWDQIKPTKPIELSTFTEIFGELHFKETPECPKPSSPSSINTITNPHGDNKSLGFLFSTRKNHNMGCFSFSNSESLQLCTEGLGFESSDEVEDSKNQRGDDWRNEDGMENSIENLVRSTRNYTNETGAGSGFKMTRSAGSFPPPISCLGRSGKPSFSLRSYRHDGRFVLTEIEAPNYEILHASREDGRLKLHLAPRSEEITNEEEEEEEKEQEANEEQEQQQGGGGGGGEEKSSRALEICNG
ncbi:hypothetical protein AAC387_Pa05g1084 [Persea americana]